MAQIQNIIFDFGGVILNIDYHKTEQAFIQSGLTAFSQLYSQLQQTDIFDLFETGKITTEQFIEAIQQVAPNLSASNIIDSWNAMLLDLPLDKIKWIQQLRPNYKTFLFSNTNAVHETAFNKEVMRVTEQPTLDSFFDKVYLSHQIGLRKPHVHGFQHILSEQNIDAAHTLFIDDSPQHIEGAQKLGLQTLYLPKGKDLETELSLLLNV